MSGNVVLRSSHVVIDPLVENIEDFALVTSLDGRFLFVGASQFLNENRLFSFEINDTSGELREIDRIDLGFWIESSPLPLRVSSLSISPDGNYLFVGYTSNGGYLGIYFINVDGSLDQVGTTKNVLLNGKSSFFTVANNLMNLIYTAQGNEAFVSVGIYSFNGGSILSEIARITYPIMGSATSLSLSPDNTLLFVTTPNQVILFPLNASGIPDTSNATIVYSSESCLSVLGISIGRCGRVFVVNSNGFQVYQRVSPTSVIFQNAWTLNFESPGGAAIVSGNESCCSDPFNLPVINLLPEYEIDCSQAIPAVPPFSISNSFIYTVVTSYQLESKCNGRPNVIFNITVVDECGRQVSATTQYTRVDTTAPKVEVVGGNDFYLECGDTVPTFDFDFLSVTDDCSPLVVSCSQVYNVTRSTCSNNSVGEALVQMTYYDSSNNSSPGPIQKIQIRDNIAPRFSPFNDSLETTFNSTCTLPISLAPTPIVSDKCFGQNVTISGPQVNQKICGLYQLVYTAQDECGNVATTEYYWKLSDFANAPTIQSLQSNLDLLLPSNKMIDLEQGVPFALSSTCQANFPVDQLFGNEETSITITSDAPTSSGGLFRQRFYVQWKIVYCGNSSIFNQTIDVSAFSISDLNDIIFKNSIPRFTIIK